MVRQVMWPAQCYPECQTSEPLTANSKGHSVPVVPSMPAEWRVGKGGVLRSKMRVTSLSIVDRKGTVHLHR